MASNLSPMYIAEISPASMRGKFVSLNQLTIVIGILLAQIANWQIADPVASNATNATDAEILVSWNGQVAWRWSCVLFSYYRMAATIIGISCYAMSLAPVAWVVLSEIFHNRIRGAAMAVATVSLWLASFLLTYTFPLLNNAFGASGTFWLYGIICVAGLLFIYKKLPETKGRTLE